MKIKTKNAKNGVMSNVDLILKTPNRQEADKSDQSGGSKKKTTYGEA